jgi:DNA-binding CsgD family transcriptional regulator
MNALHKVPQTRAASGAAWIGSVSEGETLTHLVGEIYDTALDPERWTDALAKIAAFTGGQAGALHSKKPSRRSVDVHYQHGLDRDGMEDYAKTYSEYDPLTLVPLFDVDQVVSVPDIVDFDEFRQGRFYREWARPEGWADAASAALQKSATDCTVLTIVRDERSGLVDDTMRRRMAAVVPHVRRALLIGKAMDLKKMEAASLADTLDGLVSGMILVDANSRIVHTNISGNVILKQGDFLRATGGRLVAADGKINGALQDIFARADHGDAALDTGGVALPLIARDGERYVAHVLPLKSGARRRAGAEYRAAAAVFICKATIENLSPPEIIRKLYDLTPTELRVLLAIVDVGGVPEVAASLGVAVTTIKTHLGRLFEKTGVGRQADLVKLVAGFSTPLVS